MSLRRTLLGLANLVSGSLALLIALPRTSHILWSIQMVASELPAFTLITGLPALRKHGWSGRKFMGLLGIVVSAIPYLRWLDARRAMDAEMVEAFGRGYTTKIPCHVRKRIQPSRWLPYNIGYLRRIDGVCVEHDVPFADTPQRTLKLDVYRSSDFDAQRPAVIVIHGGGWRAGDKRRYYTGHHRALAYQGYVVFDIQYRLTGRDHAGWPAQLEDVRAAIRFVKRNAPEYGVDPARIALYGRSAGGHLALVAAACACGTDSDTAVQAVVAAYAPVNMLLVGYEHDERVLKLLGANSYEDPDIYREASPLHQLKAEMPPTLALHGARDPLVSPMHADMLQKRMHQLGRPCVVLRIPWARHAFDAVRIGLGAQLTQYYVDRFLAKCLYNVESAS